MELKRRYSKHLLLYFFFSEFFVYFVYLTERYNGEEFFFVYVTYKTVHVIKFEENVSKNSFKLEKMSFLITHGTIGIGLDM